MKTPDLITQLKLVHKVFPMAEAGMGPDFKGNHHITLPGPYVCVNVWWRGQLWPIGLTESMVDEATLQGAKRQIEKRAQDYGTPADAVDKLSPTEMTTKVLERIKAAHEAKLKDCEERKAKTLLTHHKDFWTERIDQWHNAINQIDVELERLKLESVAEPALKAGFNEGTEQALRESAGRVFKAGFNEGTEQALREIGICPDLTPAQVDELRYVITQSLRK